MWAPARADWDPDATFVPGSDEEGGGRWVQHRPVPRAMGAVARRREVQRLADARSGISASSPTWRRNGTGCGRAAADADVLNLFGYTGVGSLLLSEAGARLVHVDASKKSVEQGKENAKLSGLERPPDPLDRRRCEQVHRARGAARAPLRRHPARPAQVRPRARQARSGGWRRISRRCSPTAASCSTRTAASWC